MDLKRCIPFGLDSTGPNPRNFVEIHDTCGVSSAQYRAMTVDPVGIGWGNTPKEAALQLAESFRQIAEQIEEASEQL
jgi:hypothetical protein